MLLSSQISKFQNFVLAWYAQYGRTDYPWRKTTNPYHILVSEIMLQQTQTDRVIPKFQNFLTQFPSIQALAQAEVGQVITAWQGLGYNRRGLHLQKAAQVLVAGYSGKLPKTTKELESLPGIGPYTAAAIQAFAFNLPTTVIETNIRTVFLYHFLPNQDKVSDAELTPMIAAAVHTPSPREWYSALMDYGAHLKKVFPNPSRRSKHHTKQSKFEGSNRQLRGSIVRYATKAELTPAAAEQLAKNLQTTPKNILILADKLVAEGFLEKTAAFYTLKK